MNTLYKKSFWGFNGQSYRGKLRFFDVYFAVKMAQEQPSILIRDLTELQRVGINCELFYKPLGGGYLDFVWPKGQTIRRASPRKIQNKFQIFARLLRRANLRFSSKYSLQKSKKDPKVFLISTMEENQAGINNL